MIPFGFWGQSDEANIIQDGLILYQDALDPASYPGTGVIWEDLINGIEGDLQNGPVWNSAGYFNFDGVDDRMEFLATNVAPFQFGTGNFTMSTWVFIPNANQTWFLFRNKKPSDNTLIVLGFGACSGFGTVAGKRMYYFMLDDDASDGRAVHSDELTVLGNWVHLTYVRDGGRTFKLYANGVELSQTATSNFGSANFNFNTGANWGFADNSGDVNNFNDKVAINYWYNRALSGAEVLENFEVHKTRFGL